MLKHFVSMCILQLFFYLPFSIYVRLVELILRMSIFNCFQERMQSIILKTSRNDDQKKKFFKIGYVSGTSRAIVEKSKKDLEPYLFFSQYSNFIRRREPKANVAGVSLSDCEKDSRKDVEEEEEKDGEILQGDFMEESESTENEHALPKIVISVTYELRIVEHVHLLKENQKQTMTLKRRKKWL